MAGKQVCFYLKVPSKPPTLLHRLENSLLECLIEYKPIDPGVDLGTIRLFEIQSSYQIRSSVQIIEDELLVQFTARNVGVHTARIFSNTKEICQAVALFVKSSGDVETIDVKHSISSLITNKGTDSGLASGTSTTRGVESQPTIPLQLPSIPSSPVDHYSPVKQSSHPEPGYPGDLFGRPLGATFDQLLTAKQTGQVIPGIKSSSQPESLVHQDTSAETMTTEMLHDIKKEAKSSLASFGVKIKKR